MAQAAYHLRPTLHLLGPPADDEQPAGASTISRDHVHILTVIASGATAWAREGRLLGAADLPLSNTGRAYATEAAATLAAQFSVGSGRKSPIVTIRHPADEAATETAAIIARAIGAKTKVITKLRDPALGLLEGITEDDFAERYSKRYKQWQQDLLSLNPPEGEPIADARARLFAAIARIIRRSRNEESAIVLHRLSLGLLWCWATDRPTSDLTEAMPKRPMIERFVITPGALKSLSDLASEADVTEA